MTNTDSAALIINTYAGTLIINSSINNSGASPGTGLYKVGAGTLVLTGTNGYAQGTHVGGGTLQVGNAISGSLGTGGVVMTGGIIAFDEANNNIDNDAINTGTGANNGIVEGAEGNYTPGTGTGSNITNTLSGIISGSGGFIQNSVSSGETILSGTDTYVGSTAADSGTLQIGNGISGSISTSSAVSTSGSGIFGVDLLSGGVFSNAIADNGTVAGLESSGISNTYSGVISGSGIFSQSGAGSTILTGANTYSGGTVISQGTLYADSTGGSSTGSGNVAVMNGGTLGGVGIIQPSGSNSVNVGAGAKISPGDPTNPYGSLTIDTSYITPTLSNPNPVVLSFAAATNSLPSAGLTFALNSSSNSMIAISGIVNPNTVAFNNNVVTINYDSQNGPVTFGETFVLIQGAQDLSYDNLTQYSGLTLGSQIKGLNGDYEQQILSGLTLLAAGTPGNVFADDFGYAELFYDSYDDTIDLVMVPEPSTWALLAGGLLVIVGYRRRKGRLA